MVKLGFSWWSILSVKAYMVFWNLWFCLSRSSFAAWRSFWCCLAALAFCWLNSSAARSSWCLRTLCHSVSCFFSCSANWAIKHITSASNIVSQTSEDFAFSFCWASWWLNSCTIAIFSCSCSSSFAPSRVASAFLASASSLSTINSPFSNLVCNNCRLVYWALVSSDNVSRTIKFSSLLWLIDEEMYWKTSPMCGLRSSIWFVAFLVRWPGFDRDGFLSTPNCALCERLRGEYVTNPGFEIVVIAREDWSNEDGWGVEVSSSSRGWSGSRMSSGWGELGLARAMVEVSDPLIRKEISNSPGSSSLFKPLRYSRGRVTKGPFGWYPPILFFSVNNISKRKRPHRDAPRAPCSSGGPGAYNVNSRPGCAVYWGVLVNRGPCRPEAPDATKDSEGTGRRKVLQTQPDRIVE